MSAPSGISSGVGFRNAVIFELDKTTGLIKAPSTAAYEGLRVSGNRVLTLNEPEPRRIPFPGDDGVFTLDVLPPNSEAVSGELHTSKSNDLVDALIANQKRFTVGGFSMFGHGTDQRGYENQVALMAYRQAQDTDPDSATFGLRAWQSRFMPKTFLYTRETGFQDTAEEHIYTVVPQFCTTHIWGTAFSLATEGFKRSQYVRGVSWGKPKMVAFKADGTEDEFLLPTDAPALSTDVMVVWLNGVIQTSGITKAVDKVTFTSAPTAGANITVLYETE